MENQKIIIYQVFTRLFGNDCAAPVHNGTRQQNGCGHMADFTKKALDEIRQMGFTHIWYTGLIAHATQTDYSAYDVPANHPAIVKGKAGSPYAITDYYDIDPDLAVKPEKRLTEFQNLVKRTHQAGLKLIIDFVPNHVARQYHSTHCPQGTTNLGAEDDTSMGFSAQNNFYYIPGQALTPQFRLEAPGLPPYSEQPAKATGNDNFSASPAINDWYETIKLNYGVDYCGGHTTHFSPIPSTWHKMLHILLYWAEKGIDAFRCDMAEMVPVEFWAWAIPQVKTQYPHITFIAEVYNPAQYRNYIHTGHFDFLYDKVGLYDTLRGVVCGYASATQITSCWQQVDDIKGHMLNFLENHDEQRIASDYFASDPHKALPALLVSACMGRNPMMVYFGQELGERGMDSEGFSGQDGRTTIFDYWSVDTIRRWRNKGTFNPQHLTSTEQALRHYYTHLLTLCNSEECLRQGDFYDLMYVNPCSPQFNAHRTYAFVRRTRKELVVALANFDPQPAQVQVNLPEHLFTLYGIRQKIRAKATDLLTGTTEQACLSSHSPLTTTLPGYGGKLLKFSL